VPVFDALHRRRHASDAILFAFDLIELDGEDFRPLPQGRLARCSPA
jgi:ATP-dependent DNA ligase